MTPKTNGHVRLREERGSITFALIVMLIAAGVVTALLALILGQEKSTRRDQHFTAAAQGADAGAQNAFVTLSSLPLATYGTQTGTGAVAGVSYSWTATRDSATDLSWEVVSTGTANVGGQSSTRTVKAFVEQDPVFPLAAFGDVSVDFNGNNGATSYPDPGKGIVGSNGNLTLKGNSTAVDTDGVVLYDWANNADPARCSGTICSDPDKVQTQTPFVDIQSSVSTNGFLTTAIANTPACQNPTVFEGYSIDAGTHCFTSFTALSPFVVNGSGIARVYVMGGPTILGTSPHPDINGQGTTQPNSARLQIYSTGLTVNSRNQGDIAALVFAPNASCGSENSNAQTDYYGSLICKSIDNVGGWTFHFDIVNALSVGTGVWHLRAYSEPMS